MRIELTGYDRPARLASRTTMRQADMDGMLTFEPARSGDADALVVAGTPKGRREPPGPAATPGPAAARPSPAHRPPWTP